MSVFNQVNLFSMFMCYAIGMLILLMLHTDLNRTRKMYAYIDLKCLKKIIAQPKPPITIETKKVQLFWCVMMMTGEFLYAILHVNVVQYRLDTGDGLTSII